MMPMTAQEMVSRVRRRIEDKGTKAFTDLELLQYIEEVGSSAVFTQARSVSSDHYINKREYAFSDLTRVDDRTYTLDPPEGMAMVRAVKAKRTGSARSQLIVKTEIEWSDQTPGASWHFGGDRPGQIVLKGIAAAATVIELWYAMPWPPMHWGTCQAGGTTTAFRFGTNANVTGKVIQRAGVYEGIDVLVTNDSPAGLQDEYRRIQTYTGGTTREATLSQAFSVAPDATTTYSLVLPLPTQELVDYMIEAVAFSVFQTLGELHPMPRYQELHSRFTQAVQMRDDQQRAWNFGTG